MPGDAECSVRRDSTAVWRGYRRPIGGSANTTSPAVWYHQVDCVCAHLDHRPRHHSGTLPWLSRGVCRVALDRVEDVEARGVKELLLISYAAMRGVFRILHTDHTHSWTTATGTAMRN